MKTSSRKRKIINDPIYGYITIPEGIIRELIEHRWFQRLRRIKQLGLTNLVYPGALHTRFHHALGAMHLMQQAIDTLRSKDITISVEEEIAVITAILLHDIGHGPFSHTLENTIVRKVNHEYLSLLFMERLNEEFRGQLSLAIKIFKNEYKRKFLHQLVSSQLDLDRLDYLRRDSFFTGVSEGIISSERIIKMMNVKNDALVIEENGIYSIEKFIISRRLMYWQVYLHKTVIAAENMLISILSRAKELSRNGENLFGSPAFQVFLNGDFGNPQFSIHKNLLESFAQLDDYDIFSAVKVWMYHPDKTLSALSQMLINRKLFRLELTREKPNETDKSKWIQLAIRKFGILPPESKYFVISGGVENIAYQTSLENINILTHGGEVLDITSASDQLSIKGLSKTVKKYFICYPKSLTQS